MQDAELFRRVEELHDACRFQDALDLIRREPPPHSYDFLKLKGRCLWRLGRLNEAEAAYRAALDLGLAEDDPKKICGGYLGVGAMLFEQARYLEAVEVLQKGEACCRDTDTRKLMNILNWMGQAYHSLDMYDAAARTFARGLELAKKTDFAGSEAYLNSNSGLLQMSLGNHDSARASFKEALRLHKKEGNPFGEADAVSNTGISLFLEERFEEAEPYLKDGMEMQSRVGAVCKRVLVACNLANTLLELGKGREALELLEEELKTVQDMEENLDIPAILYLAFDFYMKLEKPRKAEALLKKMDSFMKSREVCHEELCEYHRMKARIARVSDDPEAVYEHMSKALDLSFELARKQNRILSDFLSMEKKTLKFKMEAKMARFQKFEGLGLLTAGIAHDFNNSLHSILGSVNEIDRKGNNPASVGNIKAAVNDAKNLCSQLLAFSGHASMDPRVIDINNELKDILQLLSPLEPGVDFHWKPGTGLPPVRVDPIQLKNWVVSLVTNALESMDGSGTIVLCTSLRSRKNSLYPSVAVIDNGPGIETGNIQRIFDPFFSTKGIDRGMGLSAIKGAVESAGGSIQVSSEPGVRTEFVMLFPPVRNTGDLNGKKAGEEGRPVLEIALIDDEKLVRDVTGGMLRLMGHEVRCYEGGQDFLEEVSSGRYPDCIVLDMTMPGMTGSQVFRETRRLGCEAPVVLISGFSSRESMNHFKEDYPAVFLQKPFEMKELAAAVRKAMEE